MILSGIQIIQAKDPINSWSQFNLCDSSVNKWRWSVEGTTMQRQSKHLQRTSLWCLSAWQWVPTVNRWITETHPRLSFPLLSPPNCVCLKSKVVDLALWSLTFTSLTTTRVIAPCLFYKMPFLSRLLLTWRAHLKVWAAETKVSVCFYAVITVSQACNPQRSDNDIAPAFITWRRGERENADFEQMNTLTFMQ